MRDDLITRLTEAAAAAIADERAGLESPPGAGRAGAGPPGVDPGAPLRRSGRGGLTVARDGTR